MTATTLRLALAQLNFKVGDLESNFSKIHNAIGQAREQSVDLVVFSELALCGYPPRDLLHRQEFIDQQLDYLERVASLTSESLGVVIGFVDRRVGSTGKTLYNAAALCHRGEVAAKTYKQLLPNYDVFDEQRYFESAASAAPIEFKGISLGISICEDAWVEKNSWEMPGYASDPIAKLVEQGAQLLINVSASPFNVDKHIFRQHLLAGHATRHNKPLVFVNQTGGHDELIFDGNSLVISSQGEVTTRLRDFHEDFSVVEFSRHEDDVCVAHAVEPALRDEHHADCAEEQIRRALVLGLRDYVHKTGFHGAIIGLSGGIDSALTALVAVEALGAENVLTVGMPSRYSSEHSVSDARQLAKNLDVAFETISIEPCFQAFSEQLAPHFQEYSQDVTEENIQARTRGVLLMAMSNKFGKLVLTTGNKSELAVGYCTLYGDMCGALSVIGDVPKTMVYRVCEHINQHYGYDVIPRHTIDKPPSAELRPDQLDQDSLPPYEVLDDILEAYVERNMAPDEIIARGHDEDVVQRILTLLHRSEYKRQQASPALKVTSKAFGVGWRYPIAAKKL